VEQWKQRCPIKRLKETLMRGGDLTVEEFERISAAVYAEIQEVSMKAQAAPLPAKECDLNSIFAPSEVAHG